MNDLLLEVGTEELPAGYIDPALEALSGLLTRKLADARIGHGPVRTWGTPRRIAVQVAEVDPRQKSLVTETMGPPERIAFDPQGLPTVAARKFAEKAGVPVKTLLVKTTPRGAYVVARKKERGRTTPKLLQEILPAVILALPFPKTMRWADLDISFARPIHSVLALCGGAVVPFRLGNIRSGRTTFGHSFVHPGRIRVDRPDQYLALLHAAHVVADPAERKARIENDIARAAEELGGRALPDPELLDLVNYLVEFPAVVAGKMDPAFLELPREILITAMREHQKYFAVIDGNGNLLPHFIAVNNTPVRDTRLVAAGHGRVLRARLKDAQFFFRSDLAVSPEDRVEKLKGVLFQARLGSLYDKSLRVQKLAEHLAEIVGGAPDLKAHASRAGWLCKADLVSQVVVEFPKLQGVMGRVYAARAGEPAAVAAAIEEHYRPTAAGGLLPETPAGALVAIADKLDAICGCFRAGLVPTGASDPYALRRQGIGILQIMRQKGLTFSLQTIIHQSLGLFGTDGGPSPQDPTTAAAVFDFLQNRMAYLLVEDGFSKDVVAAVVAVAADHVPNLWQRARALEALKGLPDFEPLAVAFKRVVNIIRKSDLPGVRDGARPVDTGLFAHPAEDALWTAFQTVETAVARKLETGQFDLALREVASLRRPVDTFFDDVMVMAEDMRVRGNRLALLGRIAALFDVFADFSKISS